MQVERNESEARLARLQAENRRWQAEQEQLREVQQWQWRLGLDRSTSAKPPASDGPAKPPACRAGGAAHNW